MACSAQDRLLDDDPDLDERTLTDTVDLTDPHEIVAAVIRAVLEDEALAAGLKDRIGAMQERLERLQDRAAKRREKPGMRWSIPRWRVSVAPDFTVSVRPGNPSLVVVDKGAIPADF